MRAKILDLRPTQFSIGIKDVEDKIRKIQSVRTKEQDKKVPVILGPKGKMYMIDHHHFVRAMWECNERYVYVEVKADLSKLSKKKFWTAMKKLEWAFLYDQLGQGPHDPNALPDDVRGMGDNKYRSLAWMIREKSGFEKSPKPFAEFYWAEYFREHMKGIDPLSKKGIAVAIKLCKSKRAVRLPGFKK